MSGNGGRVPGGQASRLGRALEQGSVSPSAKVLLVMPSRDQCVRSLFVFHEGKGLGHKPPLGLLSIATHLRAEGFGNTEILDAALGELTIEQTAEHIVRSAPAVVGLSVMTDMWYNVRETIKLVRRRLPHAIVMLGGAQVTIYPELSLEAGDADIAVAGDGEVAAARALRALCEGRMPEGIDGVYFRDREGRVVRPPEDVAVVPDLDLLPIPDRKLVALDDYGALLAQAKITTAVTSRGCPYRCIFCKLAVQKVMSRSAELVVREFEEAAQLGFTEMEVYDDTFTWSRERALEICRGLIERKVPIRWSARSRVNKVDAELLATMQQAGCRRIHFGIESGNDEILKASRKGITKDEARAAVAQAKRLGLEVLTYFMIGFPDETEREAQDTLRFAMELDPDYVAFAVLIPYPGTEVYRQALERGIIKDDFWSSFVRSPEPDFVIPSVIENCMTRREMIRFVNRAHFKFYWRPKRVLRELAACRTWSGFRRRFKMGVNLLRHRLITACEELHAPKET
jgi:radical SAM superfamily enzyme YgiQ (UPF0313 family)